MKYAFIIPWQDRGNNYRRRNMLFTRSYLEATGLGKVYLGEYPLDDKPLNRSRLRNNGAEQAFKDGCEVVLWNDADTLQPVDELAKAFEMAETNGLVLTARNYYMLTRFESNQIINRGADFTTFGHKAIPNPHMGGSTCMNIDTFDMIRGWDEHYEGWGTEDYDVYTGCDRFVAPNRCVEGYYCALWHPRNDAVMLSNDNDARWQLKMDKAKDKCDWADYAMMTTEEILND